MLPEELVHAIVESLAYNPTPTELYLPEPRYKHTSSELCSLSLVNRRFRRICLPFLFSFVQTKYFKGLQKFRDQSLSSPQFAASIRYAKLSLQVCVVTNQ